jgi:hypothetical protein
MKSFLADLGDDAEVNRIGIRVFRREGEVGAKKESGAE